MSQEAKSPKWWVLFVQNEPGQERAEYRAQSQKWSYIFSLARHYKSENPRSRVFVRDYNYQISSLGSDDKLVSITPGQATGEVLALDLIWEPPFVLEDE